MIEQILEHWPVACDRPYVEGTAIYDTRQYIAAAPIFESNGRNMPAYQQHRMVAPTPVAEMAKWIQIVEEGLKKPKAMITEPSVFAGDMVTEPSQFRGLAQNESVLHEVDPITRQQNVDVLQDFPVDAALAKTQEYFSATNTLPQWREIDPTTGKPVEESVKEDDNLAGWKIL